MGDGDSLEGMLDSQIVTSCLIERDNLAQRLHHPLICLRW